MKSLDRIRLSDVQAVYTGPEGDLWELIMGEQIHIGGSVSSADLARKAGINAGTTGVDLCCCNGAGMRFLVRSFDVARMHGVDATPKVVEEGRRRCREEGLADRIDFTLSDACHSTLPAAQADFVWGEDAWCYVVDKPGLIAEAARLLKKGGVIAFTDWTEGRAAMTSAESKRYLSFMKFPSVLSQREYEELLRAHGCRMVCAEDTGRFAPCVELYLKMVGMQLSYDAAKILGFDAQALQAVAGEMQFVQQLASDGKIAQGLFVARKES